MSDIVTRLRGDVSLVNVQALCRDAAGEIERLRAQLDACVRTMNACLEDYAKLRKVAIDGDTLVAYRLGVKHAMGGETGIPFQDNCVSGNQPEIGYTANHGAAPAATATELESSVPLGSGVAPAIQRENASDQRPATADETTTRRRHRGSAASRGSVSVEDQPVKWISVEKQLPKWGEQVIVAHRRYDWSNARHKWTRLKRLGVKPATFWRQDENGPRFTDGEDVVAEPVAWMPLPAPPTDSTQTGRK